MKSTVEAINTLFDRRAKSLPPEGFAEILDRLLWCLDDNGASVMEIQKLWLNGEDVERIRVALKMSEAFLFENAREMQSSLTHISKRWPELISDCDRFRNSFEGFGLNKNNNKE